ncbi:MAG TPA: hypothetical protein PKX27_12965 [Bacteroidales bacterium]|nr:hypothetical protein [Bacteroidales bacterium]HPM88892.1 hypothetical protein [Bacteroidales bacterium]
MAGLAIGLTSFLLITLYVIHELSYDRFHKNYENIYRMEGFADKAVISPFIYFLVTGMVLLIGFLSTSYQTVKAASQNPADALRIE